MGQKWTAGAIGGGGGENCTDLQSLPILEPKGVVRHREMHAMWLWEAQAAHGNDKLPGQAAALVNREIGKSSKLSN